MIARTSKGRGFKGAAAYYLHDKGAKTSDRVVYTETGNLGTNDPEIAWRLMVATAMDAERLKAQAGIARGGRRLDKAVYAFSLSWHPGEMPETEHMAASAKDAIRALKLDAYQYLLVIHGDTDHRHIHVLINRVHPETGVAAPLSKDQLILSRWAEAYEQKYGVYCRDRTQNSRKRSRGEFVKHKDKGRPESRSQVEKEPQPRPLPRNEERAAPVSDSPVDVSVNVPLCEPPSPASSSEVDSSGKKDDGGSSSGGGIGRGISRLVVAFALAVGLLLSLPGDYAFARENTKPGVSERRGLNTGSSVASKRPSLRSLWARRFAPS